MVCERFRGGVGVVAARMAPRSPAGLWKPSVVESRAANLDRSADRRTGGSCFPVGPDSGYQPSHCRPVLVAMEAQGLVRRENGGHSERRPLPRALISRRRPHW